MKNRFLKFAKEIVRIGGWISEHGNQSEIRNACDPEVKEFIRPKRNKNHLPCYDNTGTRFIDISKFKSWKGRAKVKHQWESHNKTKDELELNLSIDFTAELIKPVFERGFTLKYYVAAPALYPAAVGKQNFYLDVVFPEDKDKINIRKKSIDLSFPLLNENGEEVDIKDIYVGIQLDKEQLDFNRSKQFK